MSNEVADAPVASKSESGMIQTILKAAVLLALFALVGVGVVAIIESGTEARIIENERLATLRNINELIDPTQYDNDIFHDFIKVTDPTLLGTEEALSVYRARKGGEPMGVVLTAIAPDGYNGRIKLLIGIHHDGEILGVRVLSHSETPGLGDRIEIGKSDWIRTFKGRSLLTMGNKDWAVRKDGGKFDQFTGATITPRAVVKAVHNALTYYQLHRHELFKPVNQHTGDKRNLNGES